MYNEKQQYILKISMSRAIQNVKESFLFNEFGAIEMNIPCSIFSKKQVINLYFSNNLVKLYTLPYPEPNNEPEYQANIHAFMQKILNANSCLLQNKENICINIKVQTIYSDLWTNTYGNLFLRKNI